MLSGSESQKGSENITETVKYINQPIPVDLDPDLVRLQITVTCLRVCRCFLSLCWHVAFQMVFMWCSIRKIGNGIEHVFGVYCHHHLKIQKKHWRIFSTLTMGTLKLFHAQGEQNTFIVLVTALFAET